MNRPVSQIPLSGIRIVELESIGPVPFSGLLLAQLGADVTLVSAPHARDNGIPFTDDPLLMHRHHVTIDLKSSAGQETLDTLLRDADALIEGYRPGVLERLGLAPSNLLDRHPKLVIGRCNGWGDCGDRSRIAGHDINYLALSGILATTGPRELPMPPLNLVGDFGGASTHLALGVVSAILQTRLTGSGSLVDTSILGSTLALSTHLRGLKRAGLWSDERESNLLDGGAPFYRCYQTADQKWMAVGAIEPKFFSELVLLLGADVDTTLQYRRAHWSAISAEFARCFLRKTQEAWDDVFRSSDACVTPVLSLDESASVTADVVTWEDGIPGSALKFSSPVAETEYGN